MMVKGWMTPEMREVESACGFVQLKQLYARAGPVN
jgi:hypothetical protein